MHFFFVIFFLLVEVDIYRGTIDIVDGLRSSRHFSSAFSKEILCMPLNKIVIPILPFIRLLSSLC